MEYYYSFLFDETSFNLHYVKSVCIRSYSGPYFPTFGLNTERYRVSLHIQSKCGKIQTWITLNTDTSSCIAPFKGYSAGKSNFSLDNPFSANFTKCPNTLKQFVRKLPTDCLSVFYHVVGLALKEIIMQKSKSQNGVTRKQSTPYFPKNEHLH